MRLSYKVFFGFVGGIVFGLYLPQHVLLIKPFGIIFLRLVKMVVVPLLFFSLVSGITSMNDTNSVGRVARKSILTYLITTVCAVIFGIGVALFIKPGDGVILNIGQTGTDYSNNTFNIIDYLIEVIPDNIFAAFMNTNVIQIVFFSLFTGIVINSMGTKVTYLRDLIHVCAKFILKMISIIVQLSPYAAFSLTAWVIGTQGIDIVLVLGKFFLALILAFILQYITFGVIILLFCKISPIPFYKKSIEYQMIALSTGSSKASLATTMYVCNKKLGVSDSSTAFILPLGASINMNGLSIKLVMSALFFAQAMGINLSYVDYMIIILTATLGSIGGAGIPGAFIIMLPLILTSINLPVEGVALLVGLDRILDLLSTTINITGDAAVTIVVDSTEGTLNKDIYKLH